MVVGNYDSMGLHKVLSQSLADAYCYQSISVYQIFPIRNAKQSIQFLEANSLILLGVQIVWEDDLFAYSFF